MHGARRRLTTSSTRHGPAAWRGRHPGAVVGRAAASAVAEASRLFRLSAALEGRSCTLAFREDREVPPAGCAAAPPSLPPAAGPWGCPRLSEQRAASLDT